MLRTVALLTAGGICWLQAAACGDSAPTAHAEVRLGEVTGDASVFSEIALELSLTEWVIAYDAERNIVGAQASVVVNGGSVENRVPDLRVEVAGNALEELGSDDDATQYAFQYTPADPLPGERVELLFRLGSAAFTLSVAPLHAELTAPEPGQELSAKAPLSVRWADFTDPPDELTMDTENCPLEYEQTARDSQEAMFVPHAERKRASLPCVAALHAGWSREETIEHVPVATFTLKRLTQRIRQVALR